MKAHNVKIEIGDWVFTHAVFDLERDVLYLSLDGPRPGWGDETPEGHILRFDENGDFYGVTLVGIQGLIDRGQDTGVTVPPRPKQEPLPTTEIHRALTAA